ncbi:hypothetical protein M8J76_011274 [Diaphorina citri]|nr:hypothetical protein M8J76_011274 [Diaphorina citri]
MLRIRTPKNLNEGTFSDEPSCSKDAEQIFDKNESNILHGLLSEKPQKAEPIVVTNNDDFLMTFCYDDDGTSESMHNLEPSSTSPSQSDDHVFKVPYPVTRGDQNTSLTNNANSYPVKEEVEFFETILPDDNELDEDPDDIVISQDTTPPAVSRTRRKSGLPRKPRCLKEDMPLACRMRSRQILQRKRNLLNNTPATPTTSNDIPWSEEEKLNLLKGLREHGHSNFESVQTYVPNRSVDQVKKLLTYHSNLARARKVYRKQRPNASYIARRASDATRDVAVTFRRNRLKPETSLFSSDEDFHWWTTFLGDIEYALEPEYLTERSELVQSIHTRAALGHGLFCIREFERHLSPEDTGGVDLKLAYHFLWCCVTNQPLPALDRATQSFLTQQLDKMKSESLANTRLTEYTDNIKRHIDELNDVEYLGECAEGWSGMKKKGWRMKMAALKSSRYNRQNHFLIKHNQDETINCDEPSQVCSTSSSTQLLRYSMINPLSMPLQVLKK